ncbi:flavin reductase family protein [Brucellaceae bacterium D45D]
MHSLPLNKAFTLLESGAVVLLSMHDEGRDNVMPITWTMVLDFSGGFAISTGPWNFSYHALESTRECVLNIPTVDMLDTIIALGMCSGEDTDKFAQFDLTARKAKHVRAPLIGECIGAIECRVVDSVERHPILVLEGLAAWYDESRSEKRVLHAVGDGTFRADGEVFDRREAMRAKLPYGI